MESDAKNAETIQSATYRVGDDPEDRPAIIGTQQIVPAGGDTSAPLNLQVGGGLAMRRGAAELLANYALALETIRKTAIRATRAEDWVLSRDEAGNVTGYPSHNACLIIGTIYRCHIINPTPVSIEMTKVGSSEKRVAHCSCDVYSEITNLYVRGVVAERVQGEDFTGRAVEEVGDIDLAQATRSACDAKAVRVSAGLKSVPLGDLMSAWEASEEAVLKRARCGRGFGTATDRAAQRAATAQAGEKLIETEVKRLWARVYARLFSLHLIGQGTDDQKKRDLANGVMSELKEHFKIGHIEEIERRFFGNVLTWVAAWEPKGKEAEKSEPGR